MNGIARLRIFAMTAILLSSVTANAADTPEVAEQKRQLAQAYNVAHTTGICEVFAGLRLWQKAGWPEGEAAVSQFLVDKVLQHFAPDPAALNGKPAAELEAEFGRFCAQATAATAQVVDGLKQAAAQEAEAARRFQDTLYAAAFLGQCQAASALYLQGVPEHKDRLEKFVVAEVYAKDPKYRHADIDAESLKDGDVAGAVIKTQENSAKATLYWKDCDTAEAGFQSIFEQLKPAP